jgi:hypothetical protein
MGRRETCNPSIEEVRARFQDWRQKRQGKAYSEGIRDSVGMAEIVGGRIAERGRELSCDCHVRKK